MDSSVFQCGFLAGKNTLSPIWLSRTLNLSASMNCQKGDKLQKLCDRIGDIITFTRNQAILANYIGIMRFSTTASLFVLGSLLGAAAAHNIQLKANDRECFHENLHRDDKMTVTFQVGDREFGGAGNLDIDFWVSPCTTE